MQRFVFLIAIVIQLCFVAPVSNAQQASTPDDGSVSDGVYSNKFFGFSVAYPKDWVVHGEATNTHLREVGKERATSMGALPAESAEVLLKNTYQLLTVFQYPLGTPNIEVNPSFMVVAENVRHAPAIVDGRAYLRYVRPMMIKTGVVPIQEEPNELELAGWKFFRQDSAMQISGMSLRQTVVITVIDGYALAFILTGKDQKSVEEIVEALGTLEFTRPPIRRGVTTFLGVPSPKAAPSLSSPPKPEPSPAAPQSKSKPSRQP